VAQRDQEVASSIPGRVLLRNDSGQVVHTHVPLSPSSIMRYRYKSRGGDRAGCGYKDLQINFRPPLLHNSAVHATIYDLCIQPMHRSIGGYRPIGYGR